MTSSRRKRVQMSECALHKELGSVSNAEGQGQETHILRSLEPLETDESMATPRLIGSSPQFKAVLDQIDIVAPVDCSILIHGETGTGKDVSATAIHEASYS